MTTLSRSDAAQHFERAFEEAKRLREHFQSRSQADRKRLGAIEKLLTRLKRLANGGTAEPFKPAELAMLESLKAPAAKPPSAP